MQPRLLLVYNVRLLLPVVLLEPEKSIKATIAEDGKRGQGDVGRFMSEVNEILRDAQRCRNASNGAGLSALQNVGNAVHKADNG